MSGFKDQLFEQQNDGGATTQSLSCLDAALRYATELDFIVFPAPIGKKKSHKSAKFSNGVNWGATSDPAQICRDFKKWPDANVGIPTGTENGFFVVEADTKEGHNVDGITNLQALIDAHEPLPETRRACSPSGSIHYYFRFPDGVKIKNSASELAPGVDVRGEGGMVVAPPSVKPGVGSYEWLNEADIADAPQWLLDLVIDKGDARVASAEPQPQADPTLVAMALAVIPNNDLGWEQWNNIGLATWRATGGSDAGFAAFDAWSKKSKKYNLDPDSTTTERWTHYPSSPPTEIGAGTLFHMADEASPGWRGPGKHVAGMLPWRERRGKGGFPIASFHNVRLGLVAMGIECRHDLFRDVTIIGFKGDEVTHEVKPLIGELTNAALLRLRLLFSERYCFDPEDKNILDAVKSLAYENCFDPILDMLTEAEGKWDGVNRLDTWVVDYLGCEATELNCAIGRKVLIAAARRARVPGVKFDNITVLESPEGMNKSTAIRVLAGDQFFSDQSILGLRDREVQEQLAGKWMHEIADLSGMRKADVQHVKAFASRQVDRARPAYGRVPEDRPRRSIEWGTTNDDEYLQSQTGNRRFWPLTVDRIDIEKLTKDRLQLLGEAAKYERDGESVTLDEALWPAAAEAQEERRAKDPWEDLIAAIGHKVWGTTIIHVVDNQERVATSDLMEHVLKIPEGQQNRSHAMRLADVMKKLGWRRDGGGNKITIGGKQVRGYFKPIGKTPTEEVPSEEEVTKPIS